MLSRADDIVITDYLRLKIAELYDCYVKHGGSDLLITSGLRDHKRQASAMYDNYKNQRGVQYKRKDLEEPIKSVFAQMYPMKNTPAQVVIDCMAHVIKSQVDRGELLSEHLGGKAADFSKQGVSVDALKKACAELGHFHYEEVHCHHVTFKEKTNG